MLQAKSIWASKTMWMHIITLLIAILTTVSGDDWVKSNPQVVQYILYGISFLGIMLRLVTDRPIQPPSRSHRMLALACIVIALATPSAFSQEPPTPAPTPPAPVPLPAPVMPKIDAPDKVQVPVGHLASVLITSEGCWTKWAMFGSQADAFREYDPDSPDTIHLRIIGYEAGTTYLVSYCGNETGITDPVITTVVFGTPTPPVPPGPNPPVPPGPNPPPDPQPGQVSVLIVDETSEYDTAEYKDYLPVLNSSEIVSYLNSHCAKVNGQPEWRHWDKDTDVSKESQKWQDAMKMPRDKLPWIVISTGTAGYSGPLPKSIDDTMTLLKKWGGN